MKDQKIEVSAQLLIDLLFDIHDLFYINHENGDRCEQDDHKAWITCEESRQKLKAVKKHFESFGIVVRDHSLEDGYSCDNEFYFRLILN